MNFCSSQDRSSQQYRATTPSPASCVSSIKSATLRIECCRCGRILRPTGRRYAKACIIQFSDDENKFLTEMGKLKDARKALWRDDLKMTVRSYVVAPVALTSLRIFPAWLKVLWSRRSTPPEVGRWLCCWSAIRATGSTRHLFRMRFSCGELCRFCQRGRRTKLRLNETRPHQGPPDRDQAQHSSTNSHP